MEHGSSKRPEMDPGSAGGVPAELQLSSAHDTEQLVRARGSLFLVTERHGDIVPKGARELGLFHHDTRYLSHWALRFIDLELVYLSAEVSDDAFNQIDLMVSGLDEGEFLDDPQSFLHVRRRQLLDNGLVEEITLTNYLSKAVTLEFEVVFDSDFADIFEARGAKRPERGRLLHPVVARNAVTLAYQGLDGVRYGSEISFVPQPSVLEYDRARFRIEIVAGGSEQIELAVKPQRNTTRATWARIPFGQRVGRLTDEMRDFRDSSTRIRCNSGIVERVFDQAVADLCAMRVEVDSMSILAAGIPWFCCPFGRDSLLASYEALLLNPELAMQSLRVLAAFQGKHDSDTTEEQPGKIFHELRFGEMANTGEMPHSPYYGSVDATPLFVILVDATYRITNDLEFLYDLQGALLAALRWIDEESGEGTHMVTYRRRGVRGLDNQGWKDSRAGVAFPSGERAEPPIALCEVQGYCVDAYLRGARLLSILGEPELSESYRSRGERLRSLADERLWLPEQHRYAFAVGAHGRALPTIVSNLGHLLWSRFPGPDRARATADLLLSPASFSGFGIRTLATGQAAYNPMSYHNGTIWPHDNAIIAKGLSNYGYTERAASIFEGLIHAMSYFRDHRLPELFCGMPRSTGNLVRYPVACSPQAWASAAPYLLLQAALGLHLDAPGKCLRIRNACLPPSLDWIELDGLRVGQTRVRLRLRRAGRRVHIDRLDLAGPGIRTEVEFD